MGLTVKRSPCSEFKIRVLKSDLISDLIKLSPINWGKGGRITFIGFHFSDWCHWLWKKKFLDTIGVSISE